MRSRLDGQRQPIGRVDRGPCLPACVPADAAHQPLDLVRWAVAGGRHTQEWPVDILPEAATQFVPLPRRWMSPGGLIERQLSPLVAAAVGASPGTPGQPALPGQLHEPMC